MIMLLLVKRLKKGCKHGWGHRVNRILKASVASATDNILKCYFFIYFFLRK